MAQRARKVSRTKQRTQMKRKRRTRSKSRKRGRVAKRSARRARTTKRRGSSARRARTTKRRASKRRRSRSGSRSKRFASRRRHRNGENDVPSISRMDLSKMKEPAAFKEVRFDSYIRKLQKKVSPNNDLTSETIKVLDCWLKGIFHKICEEIPNRMGRRKVIKPKIINKAMKRTVPKNMREEFNRIGMMALEKFEKSFNKRSRTKRRSAPRV